MPITLLYWADYLVIVNCTPNVNIKRHWMLHIGKISRIFECLIIGALSVVSTIPGKAWLIRPNTCQESGLNLYLFRGEIMPCMSRLASPSKKSCCGIGQYGSACISLRIFQTLLFEKPQCLLICFVLYFRYVRVCVNIASIGANF